MKNKKYEITDIEEQIEAIIKQAHVCRLAFTDGKIPYIVPLISIISKAVYFFIRDYTGLKMEMLANNPRVCFEIDIEHKMIKREMPCAFSMNYKSVIGF